MVSEMTWHLSLILKSKRQVAEIHVVLAGQMRITQDSSFLKGQTAKLGRTEIERRTKVVVGDSLSSTRGHMLDIFTTIISIFPSSFAPSGHSTSPDFTFIIVSGLIQRIEINSRHIFIKFRFINRVETSAISF